MQAKRLGAGEASRRITGLAVSLPRNIWNIRQIQRKAVSDRKRLHLIVLVERLGDIVAAEPAVRTLRQPNGYYVWLTRNRFSDALRYATSVADTVLSVSSYTETILLRKLLHDISFIDLHVHGNLCNIFGVKCNNQNAVGITCYNYYDCSRALCDVYALIGTGQLALSRPVVYPDPSFDVKSFITSQFGTDRQSAPLIIIHSTSDEAARSWPSDRCNLLARWIVENTAANILEVGLSPVLHKGPRVRCLGNVLSLSRQIAIIAVTDLFIGVDSGFAHIANACGIPSIFLLGSYRDFGEYVPWRVTERDVILRADGSVAELDVDRVTSAITQCLTISA